MTDFYNNKLILAPMAGVTDLAFRSLCKEHGADLVFSEMVSSRGLHYKDKKTHELLKSNSIESPLIVQIFGNEPHYMAEAAKILEDSGVKYLDINMGCPAPKIIKNGDGCSLMRDEVLAAKIAESVVSAVSIPVSVKIRAGWDNSNINAVSFAKVMESSGVSAITVHGRTKEQFYSGVADLEIIKNVKDSVRIPVIGNGDITDGNSALEMLTKTRCDSLMVGRGALGNPFIFQEIKHTLEGKTMPEISILNKKQATIRHIDLMQECKDERIGVPEMRKHFAWYLKGLPNSGKLKTQVFSLKTYKEIKEFLETVF